MCNRYDETVEVDYRGESVTVEALLRLLTGRYPAGLAQSRRLESHASSNLFIYMSGHGGDGFMKFQVLSLLPVLYRASSLHLPVFAPRIPLSCRTKIWRTHCRKLLIRSGFEKRSSFWTPARLPQPQTWFLSKVSLLLAQVVLVKTRTLRMWISRCMLMRVTMCGSSSVLTRFGDPQLGLSLSDGFTFELIRMFERAAVSSRQLSLTLSDVWLCMFLARFGVIRNATRVLQLLAAASFNKIHSVAVARTEGLGRPPSRVVLADFLAFVPTVHVM